MRKIHHRAVGALAASLFLPAALPAFACPDLGGTYNCPASGNQPPMTLIVKMVKVSEDGALYTMTLRIMGKDLATEYEAPPKGLRKSTDANSCTDTALLHKDGNRVVQMSLNAAGDFERLQDGKVELLCSGKKGPGG